MLINSLNKIEYTKTSTFDKFDNILSSEEKFFEAGVFKYTKRSEFTYNNKNQLVKQVDFLNNNIISETNKTYDIKGKIINETNNGSTFNNTIISDLISEKVYTDEKGNSISKEKTTRNISGEIAENVFLNAKNEMLKKETFTYFSDKKIKEREVQDIVGKASFKTEYKYENNNIAEQKEWINNELSNYTINIYNNNYITSKANFNKGNLLQYKIIYAYNEANKLIEQTFENHEGRLYSVRFSYDKAGNIMKEQQFDKTNILIRTTERTYNCK